MKDLLTVIKFTIKDMVRKKSFIISNLIILAIIILAFNIPNIINAVVGEEESQANEELLIIDAENIFEGTLTQINEMGLEYPVKVSNEYLTFEDIKAKIEDDEIEEAIIISNKDGQINLQYIVENLLMVEQVPESIVNAITATYSNLQISKLGLTEEQLQSLVPNFNLEMKQTEQEEVEGNPIVMMLMSMVLFFAIYYTAYQVSASITTEKTSKIIETLVTSTTPKTIVLGKTIGVGIVGLLQIIVIVATALISNAVFIEEGMLDGLIDLSNLTPSLGAISILYFILGYAVYALLYALTGSTVGKPEDVQTASGPVAIIAVIGFYLAYFTMMNPTSELNKLAAILPISSPFCMPFRVMMGIATTQELLISIAVILATIFVIAKVSIRIYSHAILNYGSKISFKDIIEMSKKSV